MNDEHYLLEGTIVLGDHLFAFEEVVLGELLDEEWCPLCGGSGEVVRRPSRVIGATGYPIDECLEPCPACRSVGRRVI